MSSAEHIDQQQDCTCQGACCRKGKDPAATAAATPSPLVARALLLQRSAGNQAVAATRVSRARGPLVVTGGAVGHGGIGSLHGKTAATFSSTYDTPDEQVVGNRRVGNLVETFSVATQVTLPDPPAGLTECKRDLVQAGIDTTLAAHEQQHVTAFETYQGTTSTPYTLPLSDKVALPKLAAMHRTNDGARKDATRALSKSLDPYNFVVDLTSCDKPPPEPAADTGSAP